MCKETCEAPTRMHRFGNHLFESGQVLADVLVVTAMVGGISLEDVPSFTQCPDPPPTKNPPIGVANQPPIHLNIYLAFDAGVICDALVVVSGSQQWTFVLEK